MGAGAHHSIGFRIGRARRGKALQAARRMVEEYAEGLGIDLGCQDFAGELARWPGARRPAAWGCGPGSQALRK
jgi:hypothetical protein